MVIMPTYTNIEVNWLRQTRNPRAGQFSDTHFTPVYIFEQVRVMNPPKEYLVNFDCYIPSCRSETQYVERLYMHNQNLPTTNILM